MTFASYWGDAVAGLVPASTQAMFIRVFEHQHDIYTEWAEEASRGEPTPMAISWMIADDILSNIFDIHDKVESPLEAAFAVGCFAYFRGLTIRHEEFIAQHQIGPYRVDFTFPRVRLAVELDGHAFHERTREQAVADRKRDRELSLLGWQVARFHFDEVVRDLEGCVRTLEKLIRMRSTLVPQEGE